jgi:predicted GTPase
MGLRDWIAGLLSGRKGGADPLASLVDQLRQRRAELEQASVRLGFIGGTGSGKSSLINALLGRTVAQEGVVPTAHAVEGEEYEAEGMVLVDLPGFGAVDRLMRFLPVEG